MARAAKSTPASRKAAAEKKAPKDKSAPGRPGRPTAYNPELADSIVLALHTASLAEVCAKPGMPSDDSVYRWMAADDNFAARCARARETYVEKVVDETIAIADRASLDPQDKKVRIAARQWYAEKIKPKKYGAKAEVAVALTLGDLVGLSMRDQQE